MAKTYQWRRDGCDDPVTYDLEPGDWVPVMVSKVASASTATGLIRHW